MGAHVVAPSRLKSTGQSLLDAIADNPATLLGAAAQAKFGHKLPFLLKVLAAAEPLSLQAHPSVEQAERGFAAEEAAGMPLTAPHRNYRDRNHKPELLCALSEFWVLRGFREAPVSIALLSELGVPALEPSIAVLRASPHADGISRTFSRLLQAPESERQALAHSVARACRERAAQSRRFVDELRWGARIADLYPGDVGLVVSLLLNLVRLAPGEAIYLPAGNLHAYLDGTGVELMASSDNVLRGGLTPKHIDVPELLSILDFRPLPVEVVRPVARGNEHVYVTPAPEFELSSYELGSANEATVDVTGPEIWLVTSGSASLSDQHGTALTLKRGGSAFVSAATGQLRVSGNGQVFRAKVGDLAGDH
jgi:mannose-6-phosphate isomerase